MGPTRNGIHRPAKLLRLQVQLNVQPVTCSTKKCLSPLTAKLFNLNFHPLEILSS